MTYLGFLLRFLALPILLFGALALRDARRGRELPERLRSWPLWGAIALHVVLALTYTTLWDNYLVASEVWWYDPALVLGITFGWVPLEEYLFFILQSILVGLWLAFLARRIDLGIGSPEAPLQPAMRWAPTILALALWLPSVALLFSELRPPRYLALELAWALPPIALQLGFGGDILWRYRRLVLLGIAVPTAYLGAADWLAVRAGTWTISPEQTLGILLAGVLPLEELVFFLLTCTLLVFGITLVLSREGAERFADWRLRWRKGLPAGGS